MSRAQEATNPLCKASEPTNSTTITTKRESKRCHSSTWWNFGLCSGLMLGVTVIVYVQDHVSWAVADIVLTAVMAGSIVVFCAGRSFYRYRKPMGSPLTPLLHVLVAAIRKRKLAYPSNTAELYEVSKTENHGRLLCHTHKLKFLDKAAIVEDKEGSTEKQQSPWRLATVTKVEELKLILNMIPIWLATLPFGICVAQTSTFFIKQESPPTIPKKGNRKREGNQNPAEDRNWHGLFGCDNDCRAALVERKRLGLVEKNPLKVGLQEYFYDQVPDSMRSLGIAFYLSVIGVANFISSLLITIVDRVTEKWGKSWFGKDLNNSRLDNFYWFLAIITAVNLGGYVVLARRYSYKNEQGRGAVAVVDCYEGGDGVGTVA
ncbi:major facilitator superfamily protein [Actinidia rufa]|uniref:Major facilitator superfamily protein n=1 Tax=Actinidia rufa TaxID=165716 RepID=A0A7J0GXV3_9ERIC|nr:major facilitator superfamily protein [Actinidia rufa]